MYYREVFQAFHVAGIRYLVVGGLAVNLYGYVRMTVDLDLMIDLSEENVKQVVRVLEGLEYVPRVPVPPTALVSKEQRETWIREKGAVVITFTDPKNQVKQVDIFLSNPLEFEAAYTRREAMVLGGTPVSLIALDDLIRMKEAAGRPRDREDVGHLERIRQLRERGGFHGRQGA